MSASSGDNRDFLDLHIGGVITATPSSVLCALA